MLKTFQDPPAAPAAPQTPRTSSIGDVVRDAVAGALLPARAEVRAQLDASRAERAALEDQLAAAPSRSVRRELQAQLDAVNTRIGKLQSALTTLDSKLTTY